MQSWAGGCFWGSVWGPALKTKQFRRLARRWAAASEGPLQRWPEVVTEVLWGLYRHFWPGGQWWRRRPYRGWHLRMRVTPSWQDTNNRGRDHLKSSSGQRDLLEAKQMISRWLSTKETVRWMSWKPLTKESSWLNLSLFRLGVKQHNSLGLRFWKLGLHSAHGLLWLGLCRAHSLHWLGIWQLLLRLRIHQRLGTNESHQLRHSLGGILHRLWIIHIIWSSTNYPVSLDLNILFLLGGECRKPLSMEPGYLTEELL